MTANTHYQDKKKSREQGNAPRQFENMIGRIINLDDDDDDDDYIMIVSATKNPTLIPAAKKAEASPPDEGLLKKKAALEKLNEEIAQEERLLKMKRERDALQVGIDAAKCKKRVKTE